MQIGIIGLKLDSEVLTMSMEKHNFYGSFKLHNFRYWMSCCKAKTVRFICD